MLAAFKRIVVVTGCQRSGTTLIGQVLGAHPNAVLLDEPDGLYPWFEALTASDEQTEDLWDKMLDVACKKYLDADKRFVKLDGDSGLRCAPDITHLILKAPNLLYDYEALAALDVPVSIIYPVRDPRSVVASISKLDHIPMVEKQVSLIRRNPSLAEELSPELKELCDPDTPKHVKRTIIWRIKSNMHYRLEAHGLPVFSFRYEDFVSDPGVLSPRIAAHAGLTHKVAMLSHESYYRGFGPGNTKRARPIDKKSIPIWAEELSLKQQNEVQKHSRSVAKPAGLVGLSFSIPTTIPTRLPPDALRSPIVVIGRGGSGTRLLSKAINSDVFFGNHLNISEDSLEWVNLIYEMSIQHRSNVTPPGGWNELLVRRAEDILQKAQWSPDQLWGWKLPESTIVIPEILSAFPDAKIVNLVRHPIPVCLRKTHLTSRPDNPVGRAVLNAAYNDFGHDPASIATDEEYRANAMSWLYQVGRATQFCRRALSSKHYLEIRFEDLITATDSTRCNISEFLDVDISKTELEIDPERAMLATKVPHNSKTRWVWDICEPIARQFGYEYSSF